MTEQTRNSTDEFEMIDRLCEELRDAIQAGTPSPIERLLEQVPAPFRDRALVELIAEEVQLRAKRNDRPQWEEYADRFPEQIEAARRGFNHLEQNALGQACSANSTNPEPPTITTRSDDAANSSESTQPIPGTLGRYTILGLLGSGTFGQAFKAQDPEKRAGELVAIKQLKSRWLSNSHIREQFLEEAQRMMQFDHPGIVRVYELDDEAEPPFFVQEYAPRGDLSELIKRGRIPVDRSTEIAIQIADALAHVHSFRLYHRDLKPANVLIDQHGKIRITDFGLALADADRWVQPKGAAGTYLYMPPEQLQGEWELLQARCDLWSLGVIYYEMLTGERPFEQTDLDRLRHEIASRVPPSPRDLYQSIPRRLNQLCMNCLEKQIRLRPASAADFRDDLREALDGLGETNASPQASSETETASGSDLAVYPTPNLRRFTANQADLYLRLMPKSYANREELPELIYYWVQRISETDPDETFRIGVLVGVSGCGKSSLLEAGLLPQLPENVHAVLVQASEVDTEVQLLKALQKSFPDAGSAANSWSLPEWTRQLRAGELLADGQKLVLVLDQFEQWLHARGDEPVAQLRDALQQCDGQHLQAIVCVREGFHSSLMRFVQSLDERLDEDRNYATAHRFDLAHARYVLEQFGRGLDRLDGPLTDEQQHFLDAAVKELAATDQEGVRSVRLVVLALVMAQRDWTVKELDALGGLDGIGRQFLLDSFEGRTAPEQYRRLLPAAMRVLERLVPEEGLEIKDSRARADLLNASELPPADFDTLLDILVRKLFLVTPVDLDRGPLTESAMDAKIESAGESEARYFQLTHDFLVPSVRQWIGFKEEQSPGGRARLLLRRLTGAWLADHQSKRHLPSLPEYVQIRRRTERKRWTEPQCVLMRAASRHHTMRSFLVGVGVVLLGLIGYAGYYEAQAGRLSSRLLAASPDRLTETRLQLPGYALRVDPKLGPTADGNGTESEVLHAQVGLVARHPQYVEPLQNALLDETWGYKYLPVIGDALQAAAVDFTSDLWEVLQNEAEDDLRRFRAGLLLAKYVGADSENPSRDWTTEHAEFLVQQYLNENAEFHETIRQLLSNHRTAIQAPLRTAFLAHDATSLEQQFAAARAVAQFYEDDDLFLLPLLLRGTVAQYQELYPLIDFTDEIKSQLLEKIVEQPGENMPVEDRIRLGIERAGAAITWLKKGGPRSDVLEVLRVADDPEAMTQFIHRCRDRGVSVEELLELWELVPKLQKRSAMSISERQAWDSQLFGLLLTLGEYRWSQISEAIQVQLVGTDFDGGEPDKLGEIAELFENDKSSGVHAAAGWLLRTWGTENEDLAGLAKRLDERPVPIRDGWEWYTEKLEVVSGDEHAIFYQTFIWFEPGTYRFGSPEDDELGFKDEVRHEQKLQGFWILEREVEIAEFTSLSSVTPTAVAKHGEGFFSPIHPALLINWYDTIRFCRSLTALLEMSQCFPAAADLPIDKFPEDSGDKFKPQGRLNWPMNDNVSGIRLPTEREWEAACRGTTHVRFSFGSDISLLHHYGWFDKVSNSICHHTRRLRPTLRGLFDVQGNLAEWCYDRISLQVESPLAANTGSHRVIRGGSWGNPALHCSLAHRGNYAPSNSSSHIGFRVLRSSVGLEGGRVKREE